MLSSVAWSERFEYFSSFLKYIFVVFLYKSSHCITRERKNADFHFLIDSQIIDVVQEHTLIPHREIFQCDVNISSRKLLKPSSAWYDTRILAN